MMADVRQTFLRAVAIFRPVPLDRDLNAELASHLESAIEENLSNGMSAEEARRQALIRFGGLEQTKEVVREQRAVPWLETLLQDLRYGTRMLRKYPGFTAVSVLTLALGIGANTAIFSLVDSILLRPLPFSQPENLVSVTGTYPKGAFVAMRERMKSLDVAAYHEGHEFNLTQHGEPVRLSGALVSAEFFLVLGVRPELGSPFTPGDDQSGQDNYVILSHALWQQRFASDPRLQGFLQAWRSVIGDGIEIDIFQDVANNP